MTTEAAREGKDRKMQIGMIGLGRMGANMARRLLRAGHACVVFTRDASKVRAMEKEGAAGAASLGDLAARLERPRAAWVMLPAGFATEAAIEELAGRLEPGDAIIDGGNTHWRDDVRRAASLRARGIHYLDVGTSGGVWGLERGYCLMIGGAREAVERLRPIFAALSPGRGATLPAAGREGRRGTAEEGYLHCGPSGAGHFVKMIHNGIEYGLMQAYAEGFHILRAAGAAERPAGERYELELADIAELWRRGSVIGSWLLDLTAAALAEDPKLERFSGVVQDSGEGRWSLQAAIEEGVPAPALAQALFARFRSRSELSFADQVLSAMRYQFGGHVEPGEAGRR
jgi:6-phosphogluconate dehydrogenase